jgi:hypothetical protein
VNKARRRRSKRAARKKRWDLTVATALIKMAFQEKKKIEYVQWASELKV